MFNWNFNTRCSDLFNFHKYPWFVRVFEHTFSRLFSLYDNMRQKIEDRKSMIRQLNTYDDPHNTLPSIYQFSPAISYFFVLNIWFDSLSSVHGKYHKMRLLFILFLFFGNVSSFNFLVFCPLFAHSHSKFFATIADSLTDAGHNVVWFSLQNDVIRN